MRRMKRWLSFGITLVMALSLAACGDSGKKVGEQGNSKYGDVWALYHND